MIMRIPGYLIVAMSALTGSAMAQMQGPTLSDGPMQGLMRSHDRLADRFIAAFDTNRDGKVTREEMTKADTARFSAVAHGSGTISPDQFASLNMQQLQKHDAQMFRRLDWNDDGKLSLDEYAAPLRVRFQTLDREGRGSESCAGIVVRPVSQSSDGKRAYESSGKARFCSENDLNHDGKVSHAEFDAVTAKRFGSITRGAKFMTPAQFASDSTSRYRAAGVRTFKRFDTNQDGKLSLAEFLLPDQQLFARLDKNHDGMTMREEISPRRFSASRTAQSRRG
jgi:Ca2+-binding EF-hand superfamily protein